ncbi:unnamed protein product [Adineta ricciae]|uniref:Chitin-binding type-2 domain-containing protein n=1 Tax=Adineta ricciae TaxID=249248 RepID=A0A815GDH9_ADIRI|nr:unnamed protein product [Adineta ricciae]
MTVIFQTLSITFSFVCLYIGHVLVFVLNIQQNNGFICPKDGRWPHPADCEKFYTCNSGTGVEAWCGNGMTYDIDHGRCDLSKNIDCKNGERPNWIPPSECISIFWNHFRATLCLISGKTESVTEHTMINTSPNSIDDATNLENQFQITMRLATILSTKIIQSRMLVPSNDLSESVHCAFQGNMPDPDDCQSYLTCKDEIITHFQCPDKHLFDDDLQSCNDYRKVFCGNRPMKNRAQDLCIGRPNGWYANYEKHCRSYYLCTEQRTSKMNDCPTGTKWNPNQFRCDDPKYILAPCGYRTPNHASLLSI